MALTKHSLYHLQKYLTICYIFFVKAVSNYEFVVDPLYNGSIWNRLRNVPLIYLLQNFYLTSVLAIIPRGNGSGLPLFSLVKSLFFDFSSLSLKQTILTSNRSNLIKRLLTIFLFVCLFFCLCRCLPVVSSSFVPSPPQPITSYSFWCLLDWPRWWIPDQRVQGLLWHGHWWRRLDSGVELYFHKLRYLYRWLKRNHTKTKLASKTRSGCPNLDNSSNERDRLQSHELFAVETTWQTNPHQEQY